MSKRYDQYCPVAHALGLVGERWSLLIVRELMHGPRRYTDLAGSLPGIGTNILAARLKELETCGIVSKHRLDPPAASMVYELTPYGLELKSVMRALALWGLRSIGPPTDEDDFAPGWLYDALDTAFAAAAPAGSFEFRIGREVAGIVDGVAHDGRVEQPDVVVEADVEAFYWLFVERRSKGIKVKGNRELFAQLLDAAAGPAQPAPALA
jgi:DNA-binding HxlR family transcriptional regulator